MVRFSFGSWTHGIFLEAGNFTVVGGGERIYDNTHALFKNLKNGLE